MRRTIGLGATLLALAAGVAGCSPGGGEKAPGGTPAGKPPVAVEASPARASAITEGIDVVGALAPRFDAEVKSEVSGKISDVYVTEWVRVTKGTPLARVDTSEAQLIVQKAQAAAEMARAGLLEARSAGNRASRELERAQKLKEAGLVTQQNLDDARSQQEAAAARIEAAGAQVRAAEEDVLHAKNRLSKAVIRAPFDGVVSERFVNVGEVVGEMQKVVFRIVDNRILDLTVSVPSAAMGALREGQALAFTTDAIPGKSFAGKVQYINPVVSEADRSVKVVVEVRNSPEILRGGLFVKGRIVTGTRPDVIQVPRAALLSWDVAAKTGELFVVEKDVAKRRAVRTGATSADLVEIASGLSAGETVVIRGGFNAKDGDRLLVTRTVGGK